MGGSGDVLAGCLGGLLALGDASARPSLCTAGLGVALHALAGRACAAFWPERGNRASELADTLPRVRARFAHGNPGQAEREVLPWPD